ncbi:50S ribosomal protein L29 [Wolbachia endosymbiont of Ctenocephalides felis wCfeT]|uniref:50S ribosomal protein L29 n=1 Tax=Wolbachia endosymbiont of Ctenocephalides felis wCfeT TaxID=2732593 RepID=UPI001446ACD8|nr:50S ribosomal protein L29 [Wolbachia endosymbiont of Ctenocephalides felis wCfeT]
MDIADIRSKSLQELDETLVKLRKEFVNLAFQRKLGQCSNVSRFGLIRKNIARILTVLNERRRKKKDV